MLNFIGWHIPPQKGRGERVIQGDGGSLQTAQGDTP